MNLQGWLVIGIVAILLPPACDSLALHGLIEKSGPINPGAAHVPFLPRLAWEREMTDQTAGLLL